MRRSVNLEVFDDECWVSERLTNLNASNTSACGYIVGSRMMARCGTHIQSPLLTCKPSLKTYGPIALRRNDTADYVNDRSPSQGETFILDSEALTRADSCRKLSMRVNLLMLSVPYSAMFSSISFIRGS